VLYVHTTSNSMFTSVTTLRLKEEKKSDVAHNIGRPVLLCAWCGVWLCAVGKADGHCDNEGDNLMV
jgi:hypothetical protein